VQKSGPCDAHAGSPNDAVDHVDDAVACHDIGGYDRGAIGRRCFDNTAFASRRQLDSTSACILAPRYDLRSDRFPTMRSQKAAERCVKQVRGGDAFTFPRLHSCNG
jgi:hypothetical protein